MDKATLMGISIAWFMILGTILTGSAALTFLSPASFAIVIGGTLAVVLMRFTFRQFLGSFKTAGKAFFHRGESPVELIKEIVKLSGIARKQGLLALENEGSENAVIKKGIQLVVDGHSDDLIRRALTIEANETIARHQIGHQVFKAIGESAPAMGMIGTLVGLVQMLSNMSDPKTIGPAMALALLTTLYGAMLANMFALPIADKLELRSNQELQSKMMVIEGMVGVSEGLNPRVLEDVLSQFLSTSERENLLNQDVDSALANPAGVA